MNSLSYRFKSFCIISILLLFGCSSSNKVHSSSSAGSESENDIQVIVEKLPAIVGGPEALYQKLVYPGEAKKKGIEMIVEAKISVSKTGKVENIAFDKEYGFGFEKAASNALYQVTFEPGMRNGKPIRMVVTVPVKFEI